MIRDIIEIRIGNQISTRDNNTILVHFIKVNMFIKIFQSIKFD